HVKRLLGSPGYHFVGGVAGLLLQVKESLAASWLLRVVVGDRRRELGLGGYPDVPLVAAREQARKVREMVEQGVDPSGAKKAAAAARRAAQAKALTFKQAAEQCHESKIAEFRNAKHKEDWISSLKRYAFESIGELPVADVELAH